MKSDFEHEEYAAADVSASGYEELSWTRRNGFPDWLIAIVWIVAAFFIFQTVGAIFMLGTIFLTEGISGISEENLLSKTGLMLTGNSIGQVAGLAIATMLVARLATLKGKYRQFMRFKMPEKPLFVFGVSALLIFVAQPLIWFLGYVNQLLPLPDTILEFSENQAQLTVTLLTSGLALWFLVLNIGVVPAICEEIMFRSFLHRLFENSLGIGSALVVTGLVFGLFHLNLPQVIPLSAIGILLGFLTVYSGSVYPAILVHFMHNSGTVTAVHFNQDLVDVAETTQMPNIWLVLSSLILTVYLIYLFKRSVTPTA